MDGCDGEKLLEFKGWTISVTRVVDLSVNVSSLFKKQTNIIFIFHIFKITYTFASFSVTETSSTNDGIYMSSITQGEHCYFGGQKLLAVVCLSDCIDKENKNSFKRTRFHL